MGRYGINGRMQVQRKYLLLTGYVTKHGSVGYGSANVLPEHTLIKAYR